MTPVTLTRFEKSARAFTNVDAYKACLSSATDNCHSIEGYMTGLIQQLRNHPDEPTGWSFATWRKGTNISSNLVEANAIVLEYRMPADDTDIINRIHDRAQAMGWAFFLIDTENKAGNSITVVWPLVSGITENQYARLASIFAEEIGEYDMADGCIAATHIVQVHRSSTPAVFQGTPLNAQNEIKRTAKLYQKLDARKYERSRPLSKRTAVPAAQEYIEDDMFSWPMTAAEVLERDADAILRSIGAIGF